MSPWRGAGGDTGFRGGKLSLANVFWVGGVVPLILVPLLMRWLQSRRFSLAKNRPRLHCVRYFARNGNRDAAAVVVLFLHSAVVYMLINWLPLLLVEQGFQPRRRQG